VVEAYDLEFMALKVLGSRAKDLNDDQRREWIAAFTRFTIANYARRFHRYNGQRFETTGAQAASGGMALVRSRVVRPSDTDVNIDYRLHQSGARWKIVDVYAQGTISELAMRRSEIDSFLKTGSISQLVEYLDKKSQPGSP
jgi:phospholipid transport system substrate-binding protein